MNSYNVSLLRRRQTYKYYISILEYSLKLYSFGKQGIILIKCFVRFKPGRRMGPESK
jgi:hypothetical protein